MPNLALPEGVPTTSFIDGAFDAQVSGNGKSFEVVDPRNGAILGRVSACASTDVERAVQSAHRSFYDPARRALWRDSAEIRATVLRALAGLVRKNLERLSAIETVNNGKTLEDARADTEEVACVFEEAAGHCGRNEDAREVKIPDDDYVTMVRSTPVGVCALISPWNYSLLMPTWKVAPALAAGCSVVLKPSELTPYAALELAKLAAEAGVPAGVFNVATGAGDVGAMLADHPLVRKVSFTGSVATGKKVMAACASRIANCTLELGGKSPVIVFDDVDVDAAVEWVMFGVFNNQGQVCSATSRLLVQRGVAGRFLERLVEATRAIQVGPGDHADTKVGPIVSRPQYDKVMAFLAEAREDPACRVLCGGGRPETLAGGARDDGTTGNYVSPSIVADVPIEHRLWREEVFGPVLAVRTFDTEEEAVTEANNSEFGLAGAVMSADETRCARVSEALDVGVCWINCSQPAFCTAPWGGVKQSGIGRELGPWGVEAFQDVRQVTAVKDRTQSVGYFVMPSKL